MGKRNVGRTRIQGAGAWENFYSTAEGREAGVEKSINAIRSNLSNPDKSKAESMTSREFLQYWTKKLSGGEEYGSLLAMPIRDEKINKQFVHYRKLADGNRWPDDEWLAAMAGYSGDVDRSDSLALKQQFQRPAMGLSDNEIKILNDGLKTLRSKEWNFSRDKNDIPFWFSESRNPTKR